MLDNLFSQRSSYNSYVPQGIVNKLAMGTPIEGESPNSSNTELERYLSIPGVNPDKVAQWFGLGLKEPQTFNQARLLAEAVGYNPEQAKVVAGQWQYESKGGNKVSAPFNYFGIKAHSDAVRNKLAERGIQVAEGSEVATTEGAGQKTKASFMSFGNAFDAFAGHKAFLETNNRYSTALAAPDAKGMAIALEKAGYATAPNYGTTLYNDYIKPKEANPKSGDTRPKGLGDTKSSSGITTPTPLQTTNTYESIELAPKPLESRSEFDPAPSTALGMPGSVGFEQKIAEATPIPMDAPSGFFGSGKSQFNLGGPMNNYKEGGGIHINPANKGKFTASAQHAGMGVQAFANKVLANKEDYSSTQVKRANFAHNAAGWNHQYGGNMYANGGPLTEFNEGGTHEENPLGGIPQGMAPDGGTNLVEQGETKLDSANYIFSDTLKVDNDTVKQFGLSKTDVGKTFAEVSKKMNRPNSRRENDTIEEAAKKRDLESLMQAQEEFKAKDLEKDMAMMQAKHPDFMNSMNQAMAPQEVPPLPQQDPNLMQQPMGSEQPGGQPPVDPAMQQMMAQQGGSLGGIVPMAMGGSLQHSYGLGGFGEVMRNYGLGMADTALSTLGAKNVVQDSAYKGQGSEFMRKASGIAGGIGGALLPMAANIVAPGIGGAVAGAAQQGIGMLNPEDEHTKQLREAQNIIPSVNQQQGLPIGVNYALGGGMHKYDGLSVPTGQMFTAGQPMMLPGQIPLQSFDSLYQNALNTDSPEAIAEYEKFGMVKNANGDWVDKNPTTTNTNVAKTTSTNNYPVNTGLTSTQQDLSVNESPLSALGNIAGIGYNLYQGIKKPETTTAGDFYVNQEAIRPDYTEAENEARNTYAAYLKGLQQTGLSGGAAASNLQAGALERNRAMAQVASAEENAYRADQQHVRDANTQNMINAKSASKQANWAIQAAKQEHIKEAMTGLKENEDRKIANKLGLNYAVLGAPDISKFKNVGYNTVNNRVGDWWLNQRNKNKGTTV